MDRKKTTKTTGIFQFSAPTRTMRDKRTKSETRRNDRPTRHDAMDPRLIDPSGKVQLPSPPVVSVTLWPSGSSGRPPRGPREDKTKVQGTSQALCYPFERAIRNELPLQEIGNTIGLLGARSYLGRCTPCWGPPSHAPTEKTTTLG